MPAVTSRCDFEAGFMRCICDAEKEGMDGDGYRGIVSAYCMTATNICNVMGQNVGSDLEQR